MAYFLCYTHFTGIEVYSMKKSLTIHYCIHQIAYWAAAAGIMSFATAFLFEKGFPASQVGVLLGCGSILSGVTQPALATMADRARKSTPARERQYQR